MFFSAGEYTNLHISTTLRIFVSDPVLCALSASTMSYPAKKRRLAYEPPEQEEDQQDSDDGKYSINVGNPNP